MLCNEKAHSAQPIKNRNKNVKDSKALTTMMKVLVS